MSTMAFCRGCGTTIHETAPICPRCGAPQSANWDRAGRGRSFGQAITICLNRSFVFRGRAPRSEYWFFSLFVVLMTIGADILGAVWGGRVGLAVKVIVNLVFFFASLSVYVRRLHDIDRSGWWYWLVLIPIIGWIILFVWLCIRGTRGPNRFGPDPLLA